MTLLRALGIQILSFGLAWILTLHFEALHSLRSFIGLQGLLAGSLAYVIREAKWRLVIHLCFLPAAASLFMLQLPAKLYLTITLLLIFLFWGTVRGDVPLFLSSKTVVNIVLKLIAHEQPHNFAELGAGIGTVALPVAKHYPDLANTAYELAPLPWFIIWLRAKRYRQLQVKRQNFWHLNLSEYDMIFVFLSPAIMPALSIKAQQELRPGSLLISAAFPISDWQPERVIKLAAQKRTWVYCYRVKR